MPSWELVPASEWDTVKEDRVCPTTKDAGQMTLSGCMAACMGDSTCTGAIGWPAVPSYEADETGAPPCSSPNTCKCLLVTAECDEGTSSQVVGMNVYAHKCAGVVCQALDHCHQAGSCDMNTGACSNPTMADFTPCNDGDETTANDQCKEGVCLGEDLCANTVCEAQGQCWDVGTCDFTNGECSQAPKGDGAACDDGQDNTHDDACDGAGNCAGVDYCAGVSCVADGPCHMVGVCDSATGVCSQPLKAEGSACDDGVANTKNDVCSADGTCSGEVDNCDGVTCGPADQCHEAGVCNSDSGVCEYAAKADNTPCDDGSQLTKDDVCTSDGAGLTCQGVLLCEGVSCSAADDCHDDGQCNPETGVCSTPIRVNAACDDGDDNTVNDACDASAICQGVDLCLTSAPGPGAPNTQCYEQQGQCDQATGTWTYNFASLNDQSCDDGKEFTRDDKCLDGQCVGEQITPPACDSLVTEAACGQRSGDCAWDAQAGPCTEEDPDSGDCTATAGACGQTDAGAAASGMVIR